MCESKKKCRSSKKECGCHKINDFIDGMIDAAVYEGINPVDIADAMLLRATLITSGFKKIDDVSPKLWVAKTVANYLHEIEEEEKNYEI